MTDKPQAPAMMAIEAAAIRLEVDVAAIRAFAKVESRGKAFMPDGHPVTLFERHIFHRVTAGRFDESHPHLSSPKPYGPGGYGTLSEQPRKVAEAKALDLDGGIKAASWGLFQILGINWRRAGFINPAHMERCMWESADEHLRAFVGFVEGSIELVTALRNHDWETVARLYNGRDHAKHQYAPRLKKAWEFYSVPVSARQPPQ